MPAQWWQQQQQRLQMCAEAEGGRGAPMEFYGSVATLNTHKCDTAP
jgi:hypothetical protein